jgi:hypothetical protein
MALNPFFADATAEAGLNAETALFNNGYLRIYNGSQPTDANTAVGAQTLLSTLRLGATAFGASVASGTAPTRVVVATANAITSDTDAAATGTASWFRVLKSDGSTVVMDGSVGTSGCDLDLASTSIVAGETVQVNSFTLTVAE